MDAQPPTGGEGTLGVDAQPPAGGEGTLGVDAQPPAGGEGTLGGGRPLYHYLLTKILSLKLCKLYFTSQDAIVHLDVLIS